MNTHSWLYPGKYLRGSMIAVAPSRNPVPCVVATTCMLQIASYNIVARGLNYNTDIEPLIFPTAMCFNILNIELPIRLRRRCQPCLKKQRLILALAPIRQRKKLLTQ
jgi:hypothetical protein